MKFTSYTAAGKKGVTEVNSMLFDGEVNQQLLSQAIRVYQSNQRQGTSKVKSRGEVALTKKKVYRQKGTGNARHGAKSAPIFVGGGVAHGPNGSQQWSMQLSKNMKKQSLMSAFRAQAKQLIVDESHMSLTGKTKDAIACLDKMEILGKKVLFVLPSVSTEIERSFSNVSTVRLQTVDRVNALEVGAADFICLSNASMEQLHERLGIKTQKKKVSKKKDTVQE